MIALRTGICRWMKCDNQGARPLRSELLKKSKPTNIDWASCRRAFKSSTITVTRLSWKRPAALELVSVTGTMSEQARRAPPRQRSWPETLSRQCARDRSSSTLRSIKAAVSKPPTQPLLMIPSTQNTGSPIIAFRLCRALSNYALYTATAPYTLRLADKGCKSALGIYQHFPAGSNVHAGKVTYDAVATALELEFTPAGALLI